MSVDGIPAPAVSDLTPEQARWLHDKYERLAAEEGQLSGSRTSYYAAIGTVLITGLLVALADLMSQPALLAVVVTFLAILGLMISTVWAILLHRTNDAQNLWREAARWLEGHAPPIPGTVPGSITLRSKESLPVDLARPYLTHAARFSHSRQLSWMDRLDPAGLTEILPQTFLAIWGGVLITIWVWYFALR